MCKVHACARCMRVQGACVCKVHLHREGAQAPLCACPMQPHLQCEDLVERLYVFCHIRDGGGVVLRLTCRCAKCLRRCIFENIFELLNV